MAVRFLDRERKQGGLGLYDWQQGRFTPISNPPGKSFTDPSFSPDGKWLVAVAGNQLMLIDRASLKVTALTEGGLGFKQAPVFRPDSGAVLYVATNPTRLVLVELATHQETVMLDWHDGFGTISRPCFGGPDKVIFLASAPRSIDGWNQASQFPDARPETDLHVYGFKFGARPELILKNLWTLGKQKSRWFSGERSLSASRDARQIIFIDFAESAGGAETNLDQELFGIRNGSLTQLTHLGSALIAAAVSDDGSTAVFGADAAHHGDYDLRILDLASGRISSASLLREIRSAED